MSAERRKYERMSIKSVAELNIAPAEQRRFAFVGGISRGGLEMFCQQPLPVNQAVRIRLTFLDRQGRQVQEGLEGVIRWCSKLGEAHFAGMEFNAPIDERSHPALWAYLSRSQPARSSPR
ncbi:MAG: PilZ domain-containing protein [Nitrospirota bacterium]